MALTKKGIALRDSLIESDKREKEMKAKNGIERASRWAEDQYERIMNLTKIPDVSMDRIIQFPLGDFRREPNAEDLNGLAALGEMLGIDLRDIECGRSLPLPHGTTGPPFSMKISLKDLLTRLEQASNQKRPRRR
jgi:hypothetical protein